MEQAGLGFDALQAPALSQWAPRQWPVAKDWQGVVDAFLASAPGQRLAAYVGARLTAGATIYPPQPFRALELTPLASVRVVILGQDPYHGPGQAEGLAFSVASGVRLPPSLRNIFKERQRSLGTPIPASGSLAGWARDGVLMLNTSLTVEQGLPASHAGQGWEQLTDALLQTVAANASPCVYMLWGAHAQAKSALISATAAQHGRESLILTANHPSPLSANRPPVPFMGCGHFDVARSWLAERGVSVSFG
jgi:uracil-DNA glycosylase